MMDNRTLGGVLIAITAVLAALVGVFLRDVYRTGSKLGCFEVAGCGQVQETLGLGHAVVGVLAFLLSLGIYLLLFYKGEKAILKQLEQDKKAGIADLKFELMLRMLDEPEQKVLKAVREQDGVEQSTLVLRTGLSKSKVSEVLSTFEKKNIVSRQKKGKTLLVRLKEAL